MTNKKFSFIIFFVILLILNSVSYSQPSKVYLQLECNNFMLTSTNTLQFDVRFFNHSYVECRVLAWGFCWDFNKTILNGGTGTLSIIASDLPVNMQPRNPTVYIVSTPGRLIVSPNLSPGNGNGLLIPSGGSVLIMRLRLQTSVPEFYGNSYNILFRKHTGPSPHVSIYFDTSYTYSMNILRYIELQTITN
jgi:hypothetical protein